MKIAITGAGGKTGRAVALAVRDLGHEVVPVVRRPHGLQDERIATLDDPAAMSDALADADAAYLIAPNVHPGELGLLRPTIDLCEQSGIRVVYHSVLHPFVPSMPHHLAKAEVEDVLRRSTLTWTILQPASYMDNLLGPVGASREGVWHQPYDVGTPFTPVALEDVGAAAAITLTDPVHAFATYELAGPERLSSQQMAQELQRELDRPIEVRADRDAWEQGVGEHLDPEARRRLGLMFDYYDVHGFAGNPHVLSWLLGRQPVTFTEWIRRHRETLAGS
ncbi:SDR family oxidoreductase [Blastococcus sp. Marseille-P5729]|uniref:SDR family oxidoreductase n=1 Tax=Blastococcus sp. Marseille-P5729 TaxID=2086582 RepID=UPI00131B29D3|nr:NmrA family NAD(P)-binding protein [Blastococcus sp. Marseille-P5729]